MTNSVGRILSISYDESLLRTREWILKAAGFSVTSALGFADAFTHCQNSGFDVAIIGHSIPEKDMAALVNQIRAHNHTRVLSLRRAGEGSAIDVDHWVESGRGAEALVEAVQAVLDKKEN